MAEDDVIVETKMIELKRRSLEDIIAFKDKHVKVLQDLVDTLKKHELGKEANQVLGFLAGTFAAAVEEVGGPPVQTIQIVIEGYSACQAALAASGIVKETETLFPNEAQTVH